ncbi:hypothetical protein EMGBS15_03920 [Filimonas sp.]|nr:hypothetical protein EMGBS15_03920 [Filimonas sp.]
MRNKSYLVDTNIISYYFQGKFEVAEYIRKSSLYISFITEIELKSNPKLSKQERATIDSFLKTCIILDINAEIKQTAVSIIKNHKLKLPDAIIAATASYLKLELVTADEQFDVLGIPVIIPIIGK